TMKHFEDKYGSKNPIKYWDIVNEPLNDNGTLRETPWLKIIGPDYIAKAFEYAHEADPNMKLFINDYGMENDGVKTQAMYELVKKLKDEGVPIDGIGIECHININTNLDKLKDVIQKFASLGVEIQFTEIDMSTLGDTSESALLQQARQYRKLFTILEEEHKYITAVVFWGISDDISWLGSQNAPLLFNTSLQPKPAFWAIVDPQKAPMNIVNTQILNTPEGTPSSTDWSKSLDFKIQPFTNVDTFVKGVGATAKIKTLWNKDALYILANVSDTTPSSRDNVEFFIGNRSYRFFRGNFTGRNVDETSYATGYDVQLTLPLDEIGLNGRVENHIGFDVRVNDYDNSSLKSVATWNDYTNDKEDPARYGQLTLSGKSQVSYSVYGTPAGISDLLWNEAQVIKVDKFIKGNSGATATIRTLWNDRYLYVLANVWEKDLNASNSLPYRQDSVEIFVDQHNYKTPYYTDGDGQYRVNFENAQSFGPSTDSSGFESFATKTATGYIVEMKIPLKIIPKVGDVIGFDALINVAGPGND
ncbi:MAG: endo-1,4-beta-xylanase, partial [Athalassotoga sp.]